MSTSRADYWTHVQEIGSVTVTIEMTRFGLLWHGHAARVLSGNKIDRNALAIAWGADQEQVYEDVLRGACLALNHRANHGRPAGNKPESHDDGMFVMGCWRSFSRGADRNGDYGQ
jgi:hypothetical protein